MKKTTNRILTLALTLILLLGILPLSVAAEYEPWDGSAKTVTMKPGEERFFLYVPAESGPHTVTRSTSVVRVEVRQEDESDKDAYPEIIYTEGKANPNDECYRLKGGARYIVRMYVWEGEIEWTNGITDTLSIHVGEPKKEEDLCTPYPANGQLKITVKPGEEFKYKFTPSQSGRYVLYGSNTVIDIRLRHGVDSLDMPDNQLMIANPFGVMHGYMADMTAGETYLITFSMWENHPDKAGFTDTYYLQRVGRMESAELRSAVDHKTTDLFGYVGGTIQLFPYTRPLYFEAFTTAWTVSDASVARFITDDSNQTRELELLKAGTVTVTATVDGQAVSQTITVKDRPALEVGKTTKLTFGGSVGVECAFTPAESGTYRFSMTGAGGTTGIKDTENYCYWEKSGSLSAYLKAGKTYILEGAFGPSEYTLRVTKGGGSAATDPAPPSGDEPTATQTATDASTTTSVSSSDSTATQTQSTQGDKPSHKVPVHHENGKGNVRYEDVAPLLGEGETLTVAVEDTAVTTVALPVKVLTEAAQAQTALRVELPHAAVSLDTAVLAHVAKQAQGETVELTVEKMSPTALSQQQQKQLKNKEVAGVIRVLLDGGTEIHDLGGGMASVTVPFTPEEGKKREDYTVYYLSDDGKLEKMKTVVAEDGLTFLTTHFSDYAVMYQPKAEAKNTVDPLTVILCVAAALLVVVGGAVALLLLTKKRKQ